MEFGLDILAILFVVAFVAGFIDAIAGGGGLITIPALLMTGIPPAVALGTNKLVVVPFPPVFIFCVKERSIFRKFG